MLLTSCHLRAFVCSCLASLFLAERGEDSITRSLAQRYEATQQKLDALQEKQESIVRRLEAEALTARSDKEAGRMNKEVQSAREALAEKVNNHINALKAELRLLQVPGLDYNNFKAAAAMIKQRSTAIGQAIDRMTPIIPDMIQKSQDYQHNNWELMQGYKQFQHGALWKTQNAVRLDKKKELNEIDQANWKRAFTDTDRDHIKKATKANYDLIEKGKFSWNPDDLETGEDPYADLYGGDGKPGPLSSDEVKMWKDWIKNAESAKPLPTNPDIQVPQPQAQGDQSPPGDQSPFAQFSHQDASETHDEVPGAEVVINIPSAPEDFESESSLIQVLPKGLRVRHNSSNASDSIHGANINLKSA